MITSFSRGLKVNRLWFDPFLLVFCLFLNFNFSSLHADDHSDWTFSKKNEKVILRLDVFLSSNCAHCKKADKFFTQAAEQYDWLEVNHFWINEDKTALQRFYERQTHEKVKNFSVPSFFFCESRWVGFENTETTGALLLKALKYCRKQIEENNRLTPETAATLKEWGLANQYIISERLQQSPLQFLFYSAFIDAFGACSLFVVLLFLAFIFFFSTTVQQQLKIGSLFLLMLGFIHGLSQVYFRFYYHLTPWLKWPAMLFGFVLLLFALYHSQSRTRLLPVRALGWHYGLVACSVAFVYLHQQTCAFNVGLLFEEWIAKQDFGLLNLVLLYVGYQLIYLSPLAAFLAVYLWLQSRFNNFRPGMTQFVAARSILCVVGVALMVYPAMLANLTASYLCLIIAFGFGWLIRKRSSSDEG